LTYGEARQDDHFSRPVAADKDLDPSGEGFGVEKERSVSEDALVKEQVGVVRGGQAVDSVRGGYNNRVRKQSKGRPD
jgi:hypothetical protein